MGSLLIIIRRACGWTGPSWLDLVKRKLKRLGLSLLILFKLIEGRSI